MTAFQPKRPCLTGTDGWSGLPRVTLPMAWAMRQTGPRLHAIGGNGPLSLIALGLDSQGLSEPSLDFGSL
jgi:hypothetical protein